MLAALTLTSLSLVAWASDLCPPACRCQNNLTTVGCQGKGLDLFPELPEGTEELYVSLQPDTGNTPAWAGEAAGMKLIAAWKLYFVLFRKKNGSIF